MVENEEKIKEKYKHLDKTDGPVFKIDNDPRFTKIGQVLSNTHVDELAQLYNILNVQMYLVGFRTQTPETAKPNN